MKKLLASALVTFGIFTSVTSAEAACLAPIGNYKFLFSDGQQTYYFKDATTIRQDSSGTLWEQPGDFNFAFSGTTYNRTGNIFTYTDSTGKYTSDYGQAIYFAPAPAFSVYTNPLPAGANYRGASGVYNKQDDGRIVYAPKANKPDLVVTNDNCSNIKPVETTNITIQRSTAPTAVTTITAPLAPAATPTIITKDANGNEVTGKPSGTTIFTGPTTTIINK